jgi:uncharacterized protein
MDRRANIAIIGSGISGLTAADRLHSRHNVTLYEAADYLGGHTATIDVELHGRHWAVDTGFIVFNDWTYPNFMALLAELEVPWQRSDMSFSLRCERTGLEYNGTTVNQLFAQRRNALRPSFLRMVHDILRFHREARELLRDPDAPATLAQYLRQKGYSRAFVERYLVPMGRSIWSVSEAALLGFPARFFVDFFDRHGFLSVNDRPVWQAIRGGSREYVRRMVQPFRSQMRLRTPVTGVRHEENRVPVRTRQGELASHDFVIFACHSDQALAMLEQPSRIEAQLLTAFPYQRNDVVLHTDTRLLPRSPPPARAATGAGGADLQHERAATPDRTGGVPGHAQLQPGYRSGARARAIRVSPSGLHPRGRRRAVPHRRNQWRQSQFLLRRLLGLRVP